MQHTAIDGTAKKRRAALWALCTALAVLCAVAVTYYWRVFYAYTAVPAVPLALCAAALALCGAVAVWACVYLCRSFAARAALAILLCGALFCFANPPMQAPDESTHFLRANAISMGRFDFDYDRPYPADANALIEAFPGSYVNANTTFWLEHDEAGQLMGAAPAPIMPLSSLPTARAPALRTGLPAMRPCAKAATRPAWPNRRCSRCCRICRRRCAWRQRGCWGLGHWGSCMPGALPTWPCIRRCAGWR